MESLVAWIKVTEKKRLRVVDVDVEQSPRLARRLGVESTPTLLVVRDGSVVDRLEGRATGRQIAALVRPFLDD
jgi:thioredoxin-like negative regulator of GroEL